MEILGLAADDWQEQQAHDRVRDAIVLGELYDLLLSLALRRRAARFAALVGLSDRTCWELIRRGLIPVYRIGRRTLVKPEEGCRALERVAQEER